MFLSRKSTSGWALRLSALGALLIGGLSTTPSVEAADFCDTKVIYDYERPLKHLPPVPAPPRDAHLDFAPSRIYLGQSAYGPLQVGPGKRGFTLSYSPREGSLLPSRQLDWQITSRLVMVNRTGDQVRRPREVERYVKRLRPDNEGRLEFTFEVPGDPALYRLEIVFESKTGRRLARFGENFRVLRPSLDLDFFLNGPPSAGAKPLGHGSSTGVSPPSSSVWGSESTTGTALLGPPPRSSSPEGRYRPLDLPSALA
jgi:hypothetical protein